MVRSLGLVALVVLVGCGKPVDQGNGFGSGQSAGSSATATATATGSTSAGSTDGDDTDASADASGTTDPSDSSEPTSSPSSSSPSSTDPTQTSDDPSGTTDSGSSSSDGGSSTGVSKMPGDLDPDLDVPDRGESCTIPGSSFECPSTYVCRFYSSDEGRCESCELGNCGNLNDPCNEGTDCDIVFACFAGRCTNFCPLDTYACGPIEDCLDIGHPTHGVCDPFA